MPAKPHHTTCHATAAMQAPETAQRHSAVDNDGNERARASNTSMIKRWSTNDHSMFTQCQNNTIQ
eukprot:5995151-Lingulodinium_polyedra.AAC.1